MEVEKEVPGIDFLLVRSEATALDDRRPRRRNAHVKDMDHQSNLGEEETILRINGWDTTRTLLT